MDATQTAVLSGAEEITWTLPILYAGVDDPAIERDLDNADTRADKLSETYRGRIANSMPKSCWRRLQPTKHREGMHKAAAFAYLQWSTNAEDAAAGALFAESHGTSLTPGPKAGLLRAGVG